MKTQNFTEKSATFKGEFFNIRGFLNSGVHYASKKQFNKSPNGQFVRQSKEYSDRQYDKHSIRHSDRQSGKLSVWHLYRWSDKNVNIQSG